MIRFTDVVAIVREKCPKQKVFLILVGVLLSLSSFLLGSIMAIPDSKAVTPVHFIDEINPKVAMVRIEGYEPQSIVMSTNEHGLRILQQDEVYNAPPETTFRVHLLGTGSLLAEEEIVNVNTPCPLTASKTGKIAYPTGSAQANKIVHKVCYTSEEEALEAGLRLYEN